MSNKVSVLDHGFVRLVSFMQPAAPLMQEGWTGDLEIVRNARVSYDADWRTGNDEGSDSRLVRRLHERGHTSPFEAMVFTFEVQAPIFVFRQWHRHRTWTYNEMSARYTELPPVFYVPTAEVIGVQSKKDKQAREIPVELADKHYQEQIVPLIRDHCELAFVRYKHLLTSGVPRELARSVLPVSTYSRMFATVDLHNLFHFLRLRLDAHAQYEIRVYAEALLQLVEKVVPIAVAAFKTELMHSPLTQNEIAAVRRAIDADISLTEDFMDDNDKDPETEMDRAHVGFLKSALDKIG